LLFITIPSFASLFLLEFPREGALTNSSPVPEPARFLGPWHASESKTRASCARRAFKPFERAKRIEPLNARRAFEQLKSHSSCYLIFLIISERRKMETDKSLTIIFYIQKE